MRLIRTASRTPRSVAALAVAACAVAAAGWAALPATAASSTYQAESAALGGGAAVATDHTGYTGSGFVGGLTDANKGRAAVTFAASVPAAGAYTLSLRYANGTGAAMSLSLYVDGAKVRQVPLAATANWDTWSTRVESVNLAAGNRSVAYRFDATDLGNVNLDSLTVADAPAAPAGSYEAERAALGGGAVVATDHGGYTGTGFVGGFTDGNRGNAAVTFTVGAPAGGAYDLGLRYANGTGAAMSLSLYVDGAKVRQVPLAATANWDTWSTRVESVNLAAGNRSIAYRFDATDLGNVNLDSLLVTAGPTAPPTIPPTTPPPAGGPVFQAETGFLAGGAALATAVGGYTGTGYVAGLTTAGARLVVPVRATAAGSATTTVRYTNATGAARTLSVYANGLKGGQLALPAGSGWLAADQALTLRAGLNSVGYQVDSGDSGGVGIDSVTVAGGTALAARGATVPYTEYEAENGTTNGGQFGPSRSYLSVAAEASGRRAVKLAATGQYVQWSLTAPTNSIVIRYSIPDSADGAGLTHPIALYANGTKVQDISLTSTYGWVYGAYPYTNVPSQGSAHHFFDETRAQIGNWPAGTVLKLQKDASSTAAYYDIDLVDTEQVAPALDAPANFLAITSYGAVAGDGGDDTAAINSTIGAARAQGRGVWIPAGTFVINARINLAGVAVRGAGPWYSVLRGTNGKGGLFATGSGVQIADLTIAGDVRYRDDANFDTAIEGNFGTGSLVQNVWMEHVKVGMWVDNGTDGLYVLGVRIRDTFADGVNLHGNVRNTRVDQSVVRNTGDDALAMFSEGSPVTGGAFTFNTVQAPLLANAVGVYGGAGNRVEDNLLADTVTASAGIAISTRFNPVPFSGTTIVARNTLARTGGYEQNWGSQLGAIWVYADTADITSPVLISENTVQDSTYQGLLFSYQRTITGVTVDHVSITGAGTYGIELNAAGSATFSYVTVTGAASGGLNNLTGYTVVRGAGNSGF